jgi:hypothetical protein
MKLLLAISLLAVCTAAISVTYYFGYSLPRIHEEEKKAEREQAQNVQAVELARRCKEDGVLLFRDFHASMNDRNLTWDDPEYHFSKNLNTCLVYTRYIRSGFAATSYQFNEIVDIYGNRPVMWGWFKRDTSVKPWKEEVMDAPDDKPNSTSTQFLKEKAKLFSE